MSNQQLVNIIWNHTENAQQMISCEYWYYTQAGYKDVHSWSQIMAQGLKQSPEASNPGDIEQYSLGVPRPGRGFSCWWWKDVHKVGKLFVWRAVTVTGGLFDFNSARPSHPKQWVYSSYRTQKGIFRPCNDNHLMICVTCSTSRTWTSVFRMQICKCC